GITNLGRYVIGQMIKQRFIIQTDHMSSKTATAAVAIAEQQHYPGVVSAHCCSSPQLFARIYRLGGFVDPPVQPASSFVTQWRNDKALRAARYPFGFGWGSDENGLGDQPGPSAATPIKYPFKSFDGRVTFRREQWGQRTFVPLLRRRLAGRAGRRGFRPGGARSARAQQRGRLPRRGAGRRHARERTPVRDLAGPASRGRRQVRVRRQRRTDQVRRRRLA